MQWAALVAWVVTAAGGFFLLWVWLARGGLRQREPGRIRPPLILTHFGLAAAGLVVWIVYLASGSGSLPWVALGILGAVALLGFTMFALWVPQHQRAVRGRGRTPIAAGGAGDEPAVAAETHFPVGVVGLHGLLGATTIALVLLSALGIGT